MTDTRRDVLKLGGGALASVVSLAGCTSDGSGTDTSGDAATDAATPTASSTPTETATPAETTTETATSTAGPVSDYARWLPAPSAFGQDGYTFSSVATQALVGMKDTLGDGAVSDFEGSANVPGVSSLADVQSLHLIADTTFVIEGGVSPGEAATDLESRGLSEDGTREGFTVYAGERAAAAASESALVWSPAGGDSARSATEAVVDASAGVATRYTEAVSACAALTDAMGAGHLVRGRTHAAGETFDGAVGEGLVYDVGAEETQVTTPVVFQEGQAREGQLVEWASDADVFYGEKPSASVDGRVVTAAATVRSSDIEQFHSTLPGERSRDAAQTPQVSFTYEYEETGDGVGVLTITHEGGDTVRRSELFLRGTGFADIDGVDQTSAGPWSGTANGNDSGVVAGDRVEIGVASDYEIRIVWESADGDTSATLSEDQGPNA